MKPAPMSNISVFGSKKDMEKVIEELHKLGLYHIEDHTNGELEIGDPLERSEAIANALVSAKSLLSSWKIKPEGKKLKQGTNETIKTIEKVDEANRSLNDKKSDLQTEIDALKVSLDANAALKKLKLDKKTLNIAALDSFIGVVKNNHNLKERLEEETDDFELRISDNLVGIFCTKEASESVQRVLQNSGFSEVKIGEVKDVSKINTKIAGLRKKWNVLDKEQTSLSNKNKVFLASAVEALSIESEKAQAPLRFGVSNNTFYIKGYVPKKQLEEFKTAVAKVTKNKVDLVEHDLGKDVPIKLDNPGPVKNFQFFMDLYVLPKYTEIDPTMLTFITFPLLFGFMLGDIGYGVVTLFLFMILKKGFPILRRLMNILMCASLWTILFGFLFGEVFGEEIVFGYDLPRVMSRLHQINDLLLVSLAIGVIHLNLGLLIGFYNEYKAHGLKTAVYEKVSWVVLQISAVLLGIAYMLKTIPVWYGYLVLVIAVFMVYKGEGVKGLIELPSIFSNILSYARLMAIGLASAALALVVNQFAKDFYAMGWVGWIPMVLVLVIGHGINIALGVLGPFLHSLRLHYVEFFTKFYKGGGKPFEPFGTWR